jgi:hypothetical protein
MIEKPAIRALVVDRVIYSSVVDQAPRQTS